MHRFCWRRYSSWHLSLQVAVPHVAHMAESSESTSLMPHGHFMLMTSNWISFPILNCSLISVICAGVVHILFPADWLTLNSALIIYVCVRAHIACGQTASRAILVGEYIFEEIAVMLRANIGGSFGN